MNLLSLLWVSSLANKEPPHLSQLQNVPTNGSTKDGNNDMHALWRYWAAAIVNLFVVAAILFPNEKTISLKRNVQ
jgi:hypothetical protein